MTNTRNQELDIDQALGRAGEQIRQAIAEVIGPASPATVFSEPHVIGDDLVISAAAWERGGGFGFGAGQGGDPKGGDGAGGGGGFGGGSQGRPVAVIRVGPGGIEVVPIIDFTKVGITALLAAIGLWKTLRHRR